MWSDGSSGASCATIRSMQPPRLERLGVDDQPAAFRAAQDQQVLDEAVEPLGFGADVFEQGRARGGIVGAAGTGQDLGEARGSW